VPQTSNHPIQRALISVSDKSGLADFAQQLSAMGITLLSTGGTATHLREHDIPVTDVSSYTGFPEIMEGRVKTLHPKIHGGLLARRGIDDATLIEQHIDTIDLLVVNLYPFEQTIEKPDCSLTNAIENIDIGGPTMIRAAAKNYHDVTVVVDANDYKNILTEMRKQNNATTLDTRFNLMKKAFAHTARYDAAITNYFTRLNGNDEKRSFPDVLTVQFQKRQDLRYGENPHQKAAFYQNSSPAPHTLAQAKQWQGKPLSYNNIADTDAALACVKRFTEGSACVIVKHANPCGVAVAKDQLSAYQRAFQTDATSAFGGIIAFNEPLTEDTAKAIIEQQFVEVIIAPKLTPEAKTVFEQKPNVRLLTCGPFSNETSQTYDYKCIDGGLLVQEHDNLTLNPKNLKVVSKRKPTDTEMRDLLFAWHVVRFVKSNAIVYCKDQATVGIGAGQMSRVISAKIAGLKAIDADLNVQGAVMASDAFFPFRDGIDMAAKAGIRAIIQPGGSIRDNEVIAAADEADIGIVFTGVRHFWH